MSVMALPAEPPIKPMPKCLLTIHRRHWSNENSCCYILNSKFKKLLVGFVPDMFDFNPELALH
jgi:hypothetical protein